MNIDAATGSEWRHEIKKKKSETARDGEQKRILTGKLCPASAARCRGGGGSRGKEDGKQVSENIHAMFTEAVSKENR